MKKLLKKTMENISSKVLVVDENLNFVFASNEAEAFLLFDSKNSEGKGIENKLKASRLSKKIPIKKR